MVKKGERRYGPPPGYTSSTEAIKLLGKTLYKHVEDGKIRKIVPAGHKHGFYNIEDIQAELTAEKAFSQAHQESSLSTDATFAIATPEDMAALYKMAVKLFPRTANAEIRREWMRKEPQGHFIMKRTNGDVVAYLYLLNFKTAEILSEYLHDELPSRAITREHITEIQPGHPINYCVIAGIGSDPDIEQELRRSYTAMLVRGVRHELARWGEQGIIIPHFYAFSERTEGIAMCFKLGMQRWEPPRLDRWFTFVLETESAKGPFLREYKAGLATWRAAHTQEPPVIWKTFVPQTPIEQPIISPTQPPVIWQTVIPPTRTQEPQNNPFETLDAVPLRMFAKDHGINARTATDQAKIGSGGEKLAATEREASRGQDKWYLDSDQQRAAVLFWQKHKTPGFTPCDHCPH